MGKECKIRKIVIHPCFFSLFFPRSVTFFRRSQWSKAWVCGRSPAEILGSNPTGSMDVFVSVVCYQVEVSAMSLSLVQRSPTDCGASLCVI